MMIRKRVLAAFTLYTCVAVVAVLMGSMLCGYGLKAGIYALLPAPVVTIFAGAECIAAALQQRAGVSYSTGIAVGVFFWLLSFVSAYVYVRRGERPALIALATSSYVLNVTVCSSLFSGALA